MDERYSIYLDEELKSENLFKGIIKGYIYDSMIADGDLYQFEKTCDYYSFEEILQSSTILRPLLQLYKEYDLDRAEVTVSKRNRRDEIFRARGVYVKKENSNVFKGYISKYEELYNETKQEFFQSITFDELKEHVSIHRGDFMLMDIKEDTVKVIDEEILQRRIEEAKRKAQTKKAQAMLNEAASLMMFSPGSKPMSAGNSALIGGALAGQTGAIIGAVSGLEKQRQYQQYVDSYNKQKKEYSARVQQLLSEAEALENGSVEIPYYEKIVGNFYFGIRTLFGILPAVYVVDNEGISIGFDKSGTTKSYMGYISLKDIESDDYLNSRWSDIESYITTGKYPTNHQEDIQEGIKTLFSSLSAYDFEEVIEKGKKILDIDPKNADIHYLLLMAENEVINCSQARENGIKLSDKKHYNEALKCSDPDISKELCESDEILDALRRKEEEGIKREKYDQAVSRLSLAISSDECLEVKKEFDELGEFLDSIERSKECAIKAEREQEEADRREKEKREEKKRKEKRKKVITIICVGTVVVVMLCIGYYLIYSRPRQKKMNQAQEFIIAEDYESAYSLLSDLGEEEYIKQNKRDRAMAYIDVNDYHKAYSLLEEIGDYETINECEYKKAVEYFNNNHFEFAEEIFAKIGEYKDSLMYLEKIEENRYNDAVKLYEEGELLKAKEAFAILANYKDSSNYINNIDLKLRDNYEKAVSLIHTGEYLEAISILENSIGEKVEVYRDICNLGLNIEKPSNGEDLSLLYTRVKDLDDEIVCQNMLNTKHMQFIEKLNGHKWTDRKAYGVGFEKTVRVNDGYVQIGTVLSTGVSWYDDKFSFIFYDNQYYVAPPDEEGNPKDNFRPCITVIDEKTIHFLNDNPYYEF